MNLILHLRDKKQIAQRTEKVYRRCKSRTGCQQAGLPSNMRRSLGMHHSAACTARQVHIMARSSALACACLQPDSLQTASVEQARLLLLTARTTGYFDVQPMDRKQARDG